MRPAGKRVLSVSGRSFVSMRLSHDAAIFASADLRGIMLIGI